MAYEIKEGLNYAEHTNGKQLKYRFTPAMFPKGAPILVIFSAWGTKVPSKFNDPKWNVLSFVDTFGLDGKGCGYLGEKGDFFVRDMVSGVLRSAIDTCECIPHENLFLYASSVAAPAAIVQGILFEAKGVHLNSPIIKSENTTLCKVTRKEHFDFPYDPNNMNVIERDMDKFFKAHQDKNMPTFFVYDSLHQSEDWLQNFLEEQTLNFVDICKKAGVKVHLGLIDTEGHKIHHTTPEIIALFEKYTPPKYLDIMRVDISIENNTIKIKCIVGEDYPKTGDELYAFYLMYKGEKVQVRSYTKEAETLFTIEEGMKLEQIEVIAWIKDVDGKIIREKIAI